MNSDLGVCQILLGKSFGGAERLFVDLTLELQQAGVDVLAICNPHTRIAADLKAAGANCVFIQEASSRDLLASWRISRAVAKHGSQLIHTHLSRASRLTSRARLKIPQVASIHHYGRWKYYRGADYYMPISHFGELYLQSHRVSNDRIRVTPNFTRIPALERGTRIPIPKYRLLAFGRFVEEKGFQDLILACHGLKQRRVPFELTLGGDGPCRNMLRDLIDHYQLGADITFCGWIEDVIPYLDTADLFILPSRQEPFGIVLLEAIARRLPIVTTRSKGPAEFLNEQQVFFCKVACPLSLADAIAQALTDHEAAVAKSENAFRLYDAHYTPAVVIPEIIDYYRSIRGYCV